MTKEKKVSEVKIRLTLSERESWKLKAESHGMTLSNYIRVLMQSDEVKRSPILKRTKRDYVQADPELLRQLASIGNNINQIAKAINASGLNDNIELLEVLLKIERSMQGIRNAH